MNEATAETPVPAQGLDEQVAAAIAAVEAGSEIARQAIEGRGDLLELVMWSARLAEVRQVLGQAAMFTALSEQVALTAVPQPAARKRARHARHRFPRPRNVAAVDGQGVLEFPGGTRLAGAIAAALVALKAAGKAARHPVKHALAVKAAAIAHPVWAAVSGVGAAVVLTTTVVGIPAATHALTAPNAPVVASAPAGAPGLTSAVPLPPDLAPVLTRAAAKTRTGKADTSSAGLVLLAPMAPASSSAPSSSEPNPAPSPTFTPSSWSPPPPGQLLIDGQQASGQVDVSSGQAATVTLTAQNGPVDWDATTVSADITMTAVKGDGDPVPSLSGTLWPGESITLTITPDAAQDGATTATVDLDSNGDTVTVTLATASPSPSPTTPTPTPLSS